MIIKPAMTDTRQGQHQPATGPLDLAPAIRRKGPEKARAAAKITATKCPCTRQKAAARKSRTIVRLTTKTPLPSNPHSPVTQHHPS
jgi:hypothetical protein